VRGNLIGTDTAGTAYLTDYLATLSA